MPVTPDANRGAVVEGGSSLYFGFENPGANGVNLSSVTDPTNRNNYDFPGGAAGAIESQPFDLSGMSAGDLPTLYFNYIFNGENANANLPLGQSPTDYMRDSLRVYVSGEDGDWMLVATNNSQRGAGDFDDEFDPLVTAILMFRNCLITMVNGAKLAYRWMHLLDKPTSRFALSSRRLVDSVMASAAVRVRSYAW